jgi:pimeloyl-ACP methyl ester carboxylesterase
MAAALVVGVAGGLVSGSRWSVLVAPAAFVLVFELARLGVAGPTVDGIHLDSTYGIMAFVVGRVVHGLLVLAPMMLGAVYGVWLAARFEREETASMGVVGWTFTGVASLALLAIAVLVARPATTDPIVGTDGERLPGSIAELTRVNIGGHELAMMIRGHSVDNPVLLFLAGGPGGSELGAMRRHLPQLEQDFVVVTWDQRGTGKSYDQLDPTSTLTLDGAISDTVEVTNYLRERFDQDQIYLMGQSWGSILGVLAVQQAPDLHRAYVGVGQMVSPRETDRIIYKDTLAWARETGDAGLVEQLTEIGPPPYKNILNYEPALSYEHKVYPYDHSGNSEGEGGFSENLFVKEYTLLEQIHNLGAFLDTFTVLYPQIQHIDFRADADRLDVPIYLVQGRHEARGRAELAEEWFAMLEAPLKEIFVLETSGHRPLFEQPAAFASVVTRLLDDTTVSE